MSSTINNNRSLVLICRDIAFKFSLLFQCKKDILIKFVIQMGEKVVHKAKRTDCFYCKQKLLNLSFDDKQNTHSSDVL